MYKNKKKDQEHVDVFYNKMNRQVENLVKVITTVSPVLLGKIEDTNKVISIDEVFYFETVDRKNFAYLEHDVLTIDKTLREFEQTFEIVGFIRINKSQIVNIYHIQEIKATVGMRVIATLKNGEELIINRSYRSDFIEKMEQFGGRN